MSLIGDTVIIVGAGMFGTTAALELRERGWNVTVLDPGRLPSPVASSTDVSKLVRMDYGSDIFYHELVETALLGWDRWNEDWPRPVYHQDGILILSRDVMSSGGFEYESWRVQRERGYELQRLDQQQLADRFPSWNARAYADGYFNARAGWAESGTVIERLVQEGRRRGITFLRSACASLSSTGSTVSGVVTTDGSRLQGDRVVVCAGAWTSRLLPDLSSFMGPVGQPVLHFGVAEPDRFRGARFPPWAADIANSGWYGFPVLDDGRLKIGRHGPGYTVDPDQPGDVPGEHVDDARRFLRASLPELEHAPIVGSRMCLYCDTTDGDLLIDHDPQREGVVVAAGGSGHAFKFAPLMGSIIADVLERRPNPWTSRFRWRSGSSGREQARYSGEPA